MTVGIRGRREVAAIIIGIECLIAQRICHRSHIALGIIGVPGQVPHPVGFNRVETVAVHLIGLDITICIGNLHQLARSGILIVGHTAVSICCRYQSSLPVIGVSGCVAQCIRHGGAVAIGIIGIGNRLVQGIGNGGHISVTIIGIPSGIAAPIRARRHVGVVIVGVGGFAAITIPHPSHLTVVVILELFIGPVRVCNFGLVTGSIVLEFRGISFPVGTARHLIQLVVGNMLCAAGILGSRDSSQFIVPDLAQIAICACADIVSGIKIIGEVKGSDIGGILVNHMSAFIVSVLHINLSLKIFHRSKIAVCIIGKAQAVCVGISDRYQVITVIGQINTAASAVSNLRHMIAAVRQRKAACVTGNFRQLSTGVGAVDRIAISFFDACQLSGNIEAPDFPCFAVIQHVTICCFTQGIITGSIITSIEVQRKVQPDTLGQNSCGIQIMEFQFCGVVCAPAVSKSMFKCRILGFIVAGKRQVMISVQGEIRVFPLEAACEQINRLCRTCKFIYNFQEVFIAVDILESIADTFAINNFKGKEAVVRCCRGIDRLHDDHIAAWFIIRLKHLSVIFNITVPQEDILNRLSACGIPVREKRRIAKQNCGFVFKFHIVLGLLSGFLCGSILWSFINTFIRFFGNRLRRSFFLRVLGSLSICPLRFLWLANHIIRRCCRFITMVSLFGYGLLIQCSRSVICRSHVSVIVLAIRSFGINRLRA